MEPVRPRPRTRRPKRSLRAEPERNHEKAPDLSGAFSFHWHNGRKPELPVISFVPRPVAVALPLSACLLLSGQGADYVSRHYRKQECLVPMRDGARLFTVIYSPKGQKGPFPILLNRTPYSVAPYGEGALKTELGPSEAFPKEGFIFVYQDVRGRMMSEGLFLDMTPHKPDKRGPKEVDESTDTFDTIEWLLKNAPQNNGRVGQWGISYPAFYTAAGMIDAHPALKAVSPQAPIVDWFEGDDFHRNGALWLPHLFNFMTWFGAPRAAPTRDFPPPFSHGTSDGYAFFLRLGTLASANERFFHEGIPFWNEVMAHGTYDAYWKVRNLRPHLRNIKPAVLTVGGWFDAENLFGSLQVFKTLAAQSPSTDSRLVMGPWHHGQWERDPGEGLGAVKFGAKTGEFFQKEVLFPFFMHHLKGAADPGLPKALVFNTGANRWRRFDAWPPEARTTRVYFQPNQQLAFSASEASGFDEFVSDPAKPVPFFNGPRIGMPVEYMTADQRFVATRPDVLVYQTGPLKEDLTVAGPIRVHLEVSSTGTDADWVVKLVDVYPDDTPAPEAKADDSYEPPVNRLAGYQQLVRGEVMRGKFRRSLEVPEPMVPGQQTAVEWPLNDVFHSFKKGHRLMVQVQSSWFPLMDRNPQVFMDIYSARPEDFRKATHRFFFGAQGSFLELPVLR